MYVIIILIFTLEFLVNHIPFSFQYKTQMEEIKVLYDRYNDEHYHGKIVVKYEK